MKKLLSVTLSVITSTAIVFGIAHASFYPTAGGTYSLRSPINSTATSITLSSFKEPNSNIPYTMSYLNSAIEYATIDPTYPSRSEFVSFTGITQNSDGSATLTGVTRGLTGSYPYTSSSTLATNHAAQANFILSDGPQVFYKYPAKDNNEIITGQWTFNAFPITPGTPFASTTNAGWVQIATKQQMASGTPWGSSGAPLVITSGSATSTGGLATTSVPITNSFGALDSGFGAAAPGTMETYSSSTTAPNGWIFADGSAYATTTYPALFSAIGYNFSSTSANKQFNVPARMTNYAPYGFDYATTTHFSIASGANKSWSHTVTSPNEIVIVYAGWGDGGVGSSITGATYNGVSMTQFISSSTPKLNAYYIVNPPLGTKTITVSASGNFQLHAASVGYTGVYLNSPIASSQTWSGTTPVFVPVANTATTNLISGFAFSGSNSPSFWKTSGTIRSTLPTSQTDVNGEMLFEANNTPMIAVDDGRTSTTYVMYVSLTTNMPASVTLPNIIKY